MVETCILGRQRVHCSIDDDELVIPIPARELVQRAVAAVARLERSNAVSSEKVVLLLDQLVIEADVAWWGVEAHYAA